MATRAQINDLFLRARELSGDSREAFVAAASEGDASIRNEIVQLLEADEAASGTLRPPDSDVVARWSGDDIEE